MNGVHDMGGMDGFGKVEPEADEPVFHEEWESRVLAMVRAMGAAGAFNIDTSRFYRESIPPHVYLSSSYYKKWLLGLEDMLIARGYVGKKEIAEGHAREPAKSLKRGRFTVNDVTLYQVASRLFADGCWSARGSVDGDAHTYVFAPPNDTCAYEGMLDAPPARS